MGGHAIVSLWLSAIIVCLSWAVNHYRDNAITYKAQRDKNARELKLANAAITDMQMRQRDVCCARCKIPEGLASAKAENDICVMMCMVVVSLHIKAVCQSVREAAPPPAWMIPISPDRQTPLNEVISPSERADHYAKTTGRNPESILMSSADRVAHIDGQLIQLL